MPELPEVTTTVNGLQKVLPGLCFVDIWQDISKKNQTIKQFKYTFKDEKFFNKARKEIIGKKVINVQRRAKNILINISGGYTILIHLKMTGHLLFGKYKKIVSSKQKGKREIRWVPENDGPLNDPSNRFIHVVFSLSNGKYLAFCDSRKFGKITLIDTKNIAESIHLSKIGPEPLDKKFTLKNFKEQLFIKPNGKIKTILMDQSIIAGIGNIYSDEMLWSSSINPESTPLKIPKDRLVKLYQEMKKVLSMGINFGGDSMSDYRNIDGLRGNFQHHHNVYQKKGEACGKKGCFGVIIRKVINGRSSHFCNSHQKLYGR